MKPSPTNSRSNSTRKPTSKSRPTTPTNSRRVGQRSTQAHPDDYELDPELLDPSYNQTRRPRLPSGIVINEKPSGILIPADQLETAGWLKMPSDEEMETRELGENQVTGLMLTEARFIILAFIPEYIRYKDADVLTEHGEDPTLALSGIGLYDDHRHELDKKTMEVCSEHALMFLDAENQPLHTVPIVVRFKNVALWSFKSAREDYYRKLEKTFAQVAGVKVSGKSDKWRSLGVLDVKFVGVKEGEGKNKSWCCKTEVVSNPTPETFPNLFLGTQPGKALVWNLQDEIAGFVVEEPAPEAKALPGTAPTSKSSNRLRAATPAMPTADDLTLDDENDYLDIEAEAVEEDELDETVEAEEFEDEDVAFDEDEDEDLDLEDDDFDEDEEE